MTDTDWDKGSKRIADQLLKDVGLTPRLEVRDFFTLQVEDSNDEILYKDADVTVMQFAPRAVGVPSGTLLPTTCNFRIANSPYFKDPRDWGWGTVVRFAHRRDGKRWFVVSCPHVLRTPMPIPEEDIELTHMPVDWEGAPRHRCP